MKKILFFAAALLCVTAANAKVWRINYEDNANADFKTIAAACEATEVADTDTLYCEAGYYPTGNEISRNGMTVIGPGWGFAPNYGNTSTIVEARITTDLNVYANHVKVMGIVCDENISLGGGTRSNCVIERCKAKKVYWYGDYCYDSTIKNCYLLTQLFLNGRVRNIDIIGNIITPYYDPAIDINAADDQISNVNILNNTLTAVTGNSMIVTKNSVIQDNILINAGDSWVMNFDQTGNIIRKNVFSLSSDYINEKYPDNYYVGATIANTFVNETSAYSDEAMKFQLLDTSTAKGKAYDGGDCGAFGGTSPYVICGRPQGVPYIYDVEVPAQPKDNKLHVTFKVKGQNE